ncbi:MAG: FHA domain-containing protein [Lachnospiraceae bacterium]|nr:FHA domain-containing protein [Lachnospiraceae bacterium]
MTSSLPEFIRGNQRSYLRVACDRQTLEQGYEYHMYTRNEIQLLLPGTFRNMEGEEYLYFDISSRQSLDVLLQVKKLNRQMAQRLFSDILKLCGETDKYLLNLQKVSFRSRHIMYSQEKNNFRFLYNFSGQGDQWQQDLVQLAEMLVERLDYDDDALMEAIYHFYEFLMDNQETINLRGLAQAVLDAIGRSEVGDMKENMEAALSEDTPGRDRRKSGNVKSTDKKGRTGSAQAIPGREPPEAENRQGSKAGRGEIKKKKNKPEKSEEKRGEKPENSSSEQDASSAHEKYKKGLLIELLLLLAIDACSVFVIASDNIAVLFFQIAIAVICPVMIGRQLWYRQKEAAADRVREEEHQEKIAQEYREEFRTLLQTGESMEEGTQIITMEQVFPKLYSVYGRKPEYIEVMGHQLVGSQADLVQVCLNSPGVSRIHASLSRDQQGNSVLEDLNSTNGTWVNESRLSPRVPYILNRGDKVSFAGCDYIFR